jgi:hypothetical protein
MTPAVTQVTVQQDYLLALSFNNGEQGILDMQPFLEFGVFKKIKDYSAFKQVKVAFDTIEWDVGVDLDPEFVYSKCSKS